MLAREEERMVDVALGAGNWHRDRLCLSIGGIDVAVYSGDPSLEVAIPPASRKFAVARDAPDARVVAAWRDLAGYECPGRMVFDSGGLWKLSVDDGRYLFRFSSSVIGPHPYRIAQFDGSFTACEVFLHRPYFCSGEPVCPLEYPLDELLMVHLLGRGRGADVHACGTADSAGNGFLFVGQSGAGKTTCARLWAEHANAVILSDDRIVVRKFDGTFWIYGTPWHGEAELSHPSRARVTAVFFLRQGAENSLVPVRPAAAGARLLACSFVPFYSRELLLFTLGLYEELAAAVPCFELGFRPDSSVVNFLQDRIG
jgi:hypothetical protein